MTLLVVLVGLPGLGKSTAARKLAAKGFEVVSADEVRSRALGQPNNDVDPKPNDPASEPTVWVMVESQVRAALRGGKHVVLDATSLTRRERENAVVWATLEDARHSFLVLPFDPKLCFERRAHQIPLDKLAAMVARYEEPTPDEGPIAFLA